MIVCDLTPTEKRRLKQHPNCPICKQSISEEDAVEYLKIWVSGNRPYVYFHRKCIVSHLRGGNNGEEKEK